MSTDYSAAMEMMRRSGQQGVPVTATANDVVVGFDETRLKRMIEAVSAPRRPPLGILGADAADYLVRHPDAAAGVPKGTTGVYVGDIRPGSVAELADVRRGDIVVGFAGKRVKDMPGLDRLVGVVEPGSAVTVRFLRRGTEETATLQF